MAQAVFVTESESRPVKIKAGFAHYYFGEYHSSARGPQGFLNVNDPNARIRPHFHEENQFQLFFGSPGGVFQRRELPKLLLHYSEAGTAYGPIAGGEELVFFTLRQNGNEFTGYMPEDKGLLDPARRRRHLQVDLSDWLGRPLPPAGETVTEAVIAGQDDPLAAFGIAAGPGATVVPPAPAEGCGQYYVLVAGELTEDGRSIGPRSVGWNGPDDGPPALDAGPEGARLLVARFGIPSDMAATRG